MGRRRSCGFSHGDPVVLEHGALGWIADLAGADDRRAHYYCMLVLVRHADDPEPILAEGRWDGTIIDQPRGTGGFGYDAYFQDAQTGHTGAELPLEIKNEVSHRGKAMRTLIARLTDAS